MIPQSLRVNNELRFPEQRLKVCYELPDHFLRFCTFRDFIGREFMRNPRFTAENMVLQGAAVVGVLS
jgi:hypothetical protein